MKDFLEAILALGIFVGIIYLITWASTWSISQIVGYQVDLLPVFVLMLCLNVVTSGGNG